MTMVPFNISRDRVEAALKYQGWFCYHEVQDNGIPLTCSLGLSETDVSCDFVILGVEEKLARLIIDRLADKSNDTHDVLTDGVQVYGILEDFAVEVRDLDLPAKSRLQAMTSEKTGVTLRNIKLIQVPDRNGYLPSDAKCDRTFSETQNLRNIGATQ